MFTLGSFLFVPIFEISVNSASLKALFCSSEILRTPLKEFDISPDDAHLLTLLEILEFNNFIDPYFFIKSEMDREFPFHLLFWPFQTLFCLLEKKWGGLVFWKERGAKKNIYCILFRILAKRWRFSQESREKQRPL